MPLVEFLSRLTLGTTSKMRRVLRFWAVTAVLYSFGLLLVWRELGAGSLSRGEAAAVASIGVLGISVFYVLLRGATFFSIPIWKVALYQAHFAVVYIVALYCVLDALRGVILVGMPVVVVFCAFALRPRQAVWLSAFAIIALGAAIAALTLWQPADHPLYVEGVHFAAASLGVVLVTAIIGELSRLRARLLQAVATIRTLATTDELTLLANRRHMNELLEAEQQRRAASPQNVCIGLIDIDFFKAINDKYGHAAGDTVLQAFAREAGATLRTTDTLARWGGEEFLLLMPNTRLEEALAALARIAARIESLRIDTVDPALKITFSGGVASSRPDERFDEAIHRADQAMYRAKANGRNCVVAA